MTAPAAIASAVEDALAPYGATILEVPITPVMVHRLVNAAAQPDATRLVAMRP
jgi:hypothetical protein